MYACTHLYIRATAFVCFKSRMLHFNVRFLISFASLRILEVIFEVLTDLVQRNPSLDQKEVWYSMCVDLVRFSVPISFARESDLWTPKYGTLYLLFFSVNKCGCSYMQLHVQYTHTSTFAPTATPAPTYTYTDRSTHTYPRRTRAYACTRARATSPHMYMFFEVPIQLLDERSAQTGTSNLRNPGMPLLDCGTTATPTSRSTPCVRKPRAWSHSLSLLTSDQR